MSIFAFASQFRPGWRLSLSVLVAFTILICLGSWQLQRLAWKTNLISQMRSAANIDPIPLLAYPGSYKGLEFKPILVRGQFDHANAFAFGAQARAGQLGATLVTPLRLENGQYILVERGWMPEDLLPPRVPSGLQSTEFVELEGLARFREDYEPSLFTPTNQPDQRRYYWYDLASLEDQLGYGLWPLVISQSPSDDQTGLPIARPVEIDLPNNHLSYALTWYGLAGGLLAVFAAFGWKRQT